MTLAATDGSLAGDVLDDDDFVLEDVSTGMFASGFGHLGDGRRFSFHVHRAQLVVEVYRARRLGPVPLPEDVIATARRPLADLDAGDGRSLSAAVRDVIGALGPLARSAR